MQKVKKIPLRKCTGCNEMKSKKELIRVVKSSEGEISLDLTGKKSGRGAYICHDENCFLQARKKRALERAFSQKIEDDLYDKLALELNSQKENT